MTEFNLSGKWSLIYSTERPESTDTLPDFTGAYETDAVPGYWEDMYESLSDAPFFKDIQINPEYEYLEYPIIIPMEKSVPDMSLETVVGTFWYNRVIAIPADLGDKNVTLKCVGVQNRALLWVNGAFVGEHCGYSAPFEMDITAFVKAGESNSLTLAVSNHQALNENGDPISGCTSRAANRYTGGIMGDITVEIKDRNFIRSAYVTPYDAETDSVGVVAEVVAHGDYKIKWQVFNGGLNYVSCGSSDTSEFRIPKIKKMKFWSPEEPQVYELWMTVCCENRVCETYKVNFGIRNFECRDEKFYLNSKPVYLRGICEHGYFPLTVHPTTDVEYYKKNIKKLKDLGFNFIRFHTWIPTEEYMNAADEMGMLLHVESPNNTTVVEWESIMRFVRRHPSVVICCMGNEMFINEDNIERYRRCAEITHAVARGVNFSPLNAIRGVEYLFREGDEYVEPELEYHAEANGYPFKYHPGRMEKLREFCDLFSCFTQSHHSYNCQYGSAEAVDEVQKFYRKPRISHEICILGTYPDITLEKRYEGSRIGKTLLFAGPRRMLEELGLVNKAATYYKNSSLWQSLLRKHTFELTRHSKTISGYDFLGDIDHHWHTSGYRVGLMNEFYELKPGVTVENVLQYNNASVILSSLDARRTFLEETDFQIDFSVSHYAGEDLEDATLSVKLNSADNSFLEEYAFNVSAKNGEVTDIATLKTALPKVSRPTKVEINATLEKDSFSINNTWEIWVIPEVEERVPDFIVTDELTDEILERLVNGEDVLMYGTKGFYDSELSFQIAFPGRVAGNLATVIENHPLVNTLDHDGFCSWQFRDLMNSSRSIYFPPTTTVPFEPIIDVATSYKWVRRTTALVELKVGKGRLLISTFSSFSEDIMARWWRRNLVDYMSSSDFRPKVEITLDDLKTLFSNGEDIVIAANTNVAINTNDVTMKKNK
ncbi:MAG: hypothetical protein IKV53_02340 [Clostridia bacterium]|nr:hypothetical protein [Clostridia bacterium]